MAYPMLVDAQLENLAMGRSGKNIPSEWSWELSCLTMEYLVPFDKDAYNEMNKDKKTDLLQYEVAWCCKLNCELKKHGIKKV
jgi:hypothetical protein